MNSVMIVVLFLSRAHYNVVMKEIEVGGDPLDVPSDAFESGDRKGTIIDSGTTLAYFPQEVYVPLIEKVGGIFQSSLLESKHEVCILTSYHIYVFFIRFCLSSLI